MRRAARIDANQPEIVAAFRRLGFSVAVTSMIGHGFPDIIIALHGQTWMVEIKDGRKSASQRELTEDEKKFHDTWRGGIFIVESVEDAIALGKILIGEYSWDTKD